jgi:hypothetical protein
MPMHDKGQKTSPTSDQLEQASNPPIGSVTSSFFVSMDQVFQTSNVGQGPVLMHQTLPILCNFCGIRVLKNALLWGTVPVIFKLAQLSFILYLRCIS